MSWLEFIAELVKALAWPCAAAFTVFQFRDNIRKVIDKLERAKFKDLELEFRERLLEIKVAGSQIARRAKRKKLEQQPAKSLGRQTIEASEAPPIANTVDFLGRLSDEDFKSVLDASPKMAIAEAWRDVEAAAELALARQNPELNVGSINRDVLSKALMEHGLLDSASKRYFDEIYELRNKALHASGFEPSRAVAVDYISSVVDLKNHFEMMDLELRLRDLERDESKN